MSWDDSEKKLSQESAGTLFQLVWKTLESTGKKLWERKKVKEALKNYQENYLDRYGAIKVLGMSEAVPLNKVYTSVQVVDPAYRNSFKCIESMEKDFREKGWLSFERLHKVPGILLANEKQFLNVLGAPGSGKTTFLKRIGYESLRSSVSEEENRDEKLEFIHECIPVFIELRNYRKSAIELFEAITDEFSKTGLPYSEEFVSAALDDGKLLILIDGVDEVSSDLLSDTLKNISVFTKNYKKNRYVTSCRTAFYKSFFERYTDVEISSFDNDQIHSFVSNWFSKDESIGLSISEEFIDHLYRDENRATLDLARTPLLLTFLCLVFDDSQRFPANRSSLYKKALFILLEKWAAEKRVHNEPIYQDLHSELEIEMLSEISAEAYQKNRIFFSEAELINGFKEYLEDTVNAPVTLEARKILEAIEIQQGLIIKRAEDTYSFSHLTIQEYLTAYHYQNGARYIDLIQKHLYEKRWREVFLLLSGMSSADSILKEIEAKVRSTSFQKGDVEGFIAYIDSVCLFDENNIEQNILRRIFMLCIFVALKRYRFGASIRYDKEAFDLLKAANLEFHGENTFGIVLCDDDLVNIFNIILSENWIIKNNHGMSDQELIDSLNKYGDLKSKTKLVLDVLDADEAIQKYLKTDMPGVIEYIEGYTTLFLCKNSALRVSSSCWNDILLTMFCRNP